MSAKPCTDSADSTKKDIHSLCISRVPIFNHLPYDELKVIANKATMQIYQRGQFVYQSGDLSDQLFIVHKGKVKIYRLSETGKEQLVRILRSGDFTGEFALFSDQKHDSYAQVAELTQICTISRANVHSLLLKYPAISLHVLAEMSKRLDSSEKQTAVIATESVNARIGQYLADLAEEANALSFSLPMARKDLASYLGTTPETLSRRFSDFESAGWIQQTGQRQIEILDLDALLLI